MKTIKRAFFVLGPESSGTRMITEAVIRSGALGDAGHRQRLDNGFEATADQIVFRRSVPHADAQSPAIAAKVDELRSVGYEVLPLLIMRDLNACAASQVRNRHAVSEEAAKEKIRAAILHIYSELAVVGLWPFVIQYEPFVASPIVRSACFRSLGLSLPEMDYFDGNEKYRTDCTLEIESSTLQVNSVCRET